MMNEEQKLKTALFLLNDPDPVLVRVIRNKFKKDAGWESVIAGNYEEAVKQFENHKPSVVITEIIIGDEKGRSGFDFIEEIKSKSVAGYAQIVIFTDLHQDEDKERAKKLGVKYYFVKSEVSLNELIKDIQGLIA